MNKFWLILTFWGGISNFGFAQVNLDSLNYLLKNIGETNYQPKAYILNEIARAYRETNPNKASKYAHEAEEIALKTNSIKELGEIYENLGWVYYRQGDTPIALEYSLKSLKINEQQQNKLAIINTLNNIAAIYVDQSKFNLGLENLFKALQLADTPNLFKVKTRTLNNLAYNYLSQKKLDSALYYSFTSLELSQKFNYPESIAFSKRNLGDVYLAKNQFDKARTFYQEGLVISQKVKHNFLVATLTICIGETYLQEKPAEALKYFRESIDLVKKYGYQEELPYIYQKITEVALAQNDYQLAYQYSNLYASIKDTLANFERIRQMEYLNHQAGSLKKQAQIDLLAKDTELKKAEIKAQRQLIWVIFAILALISFLLVFVIYVNRTRQRTNQLLQKQKSELEQKNTEISAQKEEIKIQAEHLQELNDLKNKLFSIISHDLRTPIGSLKNVFYLLENSHLNQEDFLEIALALRKSVDATFHTLDNLLHWVLSQMEGISVKPTRLDIQAMAQNKLELYAELIQQKKLEIDNQIPTKTYLWADFQHIDLVLRNLLSNAIKFTPRGGKIEIRYFPQNDFGEVWIKDSGVGILPENLGKLFQIKQHISRYGTENEKGTGIGLLLCKEFIEKNQGKILVESESGKGSIFKFCLPLAIEAGYP
jgi:two-component system, sensor histidine kinase and response regulator